MLYFELNLNFIDFSILSLTASTRYSRFQTKGRGKKYYAAVDIIDTASPSVCPIITGLLPCLRDLLKYWRKGRNGLKIVLTFTDIVSTAGQQLPPAIFLEDPEQKIIWNKNLESYLDESVEAVRN